jgi:hypothetical protein
MIGRFGAAIGVYVQVIRALRLVGSNDAMTGFPVTLPAVQLPGCIVLTGNYLPSRSARGFAWKSYRDHFGSIPISSIATSSGFARLVAFDTFL